MIYVVMLILQELWLHKDELCILSTVHPDFVVIGTCAMDEHKDLTRGRQYAWRCVF